jgi:hypothetical protein
MQPFHEESLAGYGYSTYNNWAAKVPSPSLAKGFAWGLNTPLMHNQSRCVQYILYTLWAIKNVVLYRRNGVKNSAYDDCLNIL